MYFSFILIKKLIYLIVLTLILGLVLTGCFLSNIGQAPATGQSGITCLTKGLYTGLVGLWSFDEGIGNKAYDSSGYGNTGTLIKGPQWMAGKFGSALSFDGGDDYVNCEENVDITTAITIEAWINPSAFTDYDAIVTNFEWREVAERQGWSFRVMENKKLVWRAVLSGNNTYSIMSNSTMEVDNWYHVVLTHDASNTRLYINGSLDKVEAPGGAIVNLGKALKIGWDDYAAERVFNGVIDEVRIWNTALSPSTIEDHAAGIYGFNGLMTPYAPPEEKTFKFGRTIPLKWQYTDFNSNVVDSVDAYPVVEYQFAGTGNGGGDLELTEDPGLSGLRYNIDTKTWQFNWQTKGLKDGAGTYKIWITNIQTGQVNGPFLIELQ